MFIITDDPKSKTEIAQIATKMLVTSVAASGAEKVITEHTEHTSDEKLVQASSVMIGMYIGHKLSPITDAAVQKVANQLSKIKLKRRSKKNDETPES